MTDPKFSKSKQIIIGNTLEMNYKHIGPSPVIEFVVNICRFRILMLAAENTMYESPP